MALDAGSITINDDFTYSGTGLAYALWDGAWWPNTYEVFATRYGNVPKSIRLSMMRDGATLITALATATVDYLIANAEVTITVSTSDAGLQRTPNPNNANTATQAPSGNVTLATKGTIA